MYTFKLSNSKEDWNELITGSNQSSIFSKTIFLDSISLKYKLYLVTKNDNILLGALVFDNEIISNKTS